MSGGFEIIGGSGNLPPELAELLGLVKQSQDRQSMTVDATIARVDAFLTGLDVDGLMALRAIINTGDMQKSISANFWDGQFVALLRYVHHVDPETGKDPLAVDTEAPTL